MELRQLEYFLSVAEEGHFTRAAALCGVSQSGLSSAIRSLEDELGVELLARTTRSVQLTESGRALLPFARQALTQISAGRDAVLGAAELLTKIRQIGLRWVTGATLSPMNCFLLLRGLKTLELRMERHSSSALTVARMLETHGRVATISYPGLQSFAGHELAKRQMSGFGGLISFELDGGMEQGMALMNKLSVITRAVSLGDCETLIQHPASMTHAVYSPEDRQKHGISDGLLRLSIGLETVDDIVEDLQQALDLL